MHVLHRPHPTRPAVVAGAAIIAVVIALVLMAALRSVSVSPGDIGTPAAIIAPSRAPATTTLERSPLAPLLSAPAPLRWGTSPVAPSLRR